MSAMFVFGGPLKGVAWVAETRISNPTPESSVPSTRQGRAKAWHVEQQRARGCDSQNTENRAARLTYEAADCESKRIHRLASSRTLLRRSVHEEITLARTPSGTARSTHRSAMRGVMRTKTRDVSYLH